VATGAAHVDAAPMVCVPVRAGGVGSTVTFADPITFSARVALGGFTVPATGEVDTSSGAFESEGDVTAGTGAFRGVSGHLTFTGRKT
jgi:hypothetical protein